MARFRVTAPLVVSYRSKGNSIMLEPGAIIDTADLPGHWKPPPSAVEALDADAISMLRDELNAIRKRAGGEASVWGLGSLLYRLGGSLADHPEFGEEHRLRVEAAARAPAKGKA